MIFGTVLNNLEFTCHVYDDVHEMLESLSRRDVDREIEEQSNDPNEPFLSENGTDGGVRVIKLRQTMHRATEVVKAGSIGRRESVRGRPGHP